MKLINVFSNPMNFNFLNRKNSKMDVSRYITLAKSHPGEL